LQGGFSRAFTLASTGKFFPAKLNHVPTEAFALQAVLPGWKQKVVTLAGALGAPGLLLISFLDSSVLSFPIINDLLLIQLSIEHPARMPLYALMAATGSVLGCVLLYFIARKGGEAYFHKKAGPRARSIRHWVETNGFLGMLVAALLPPPTPFKIFVFAAGVFEVPLWSFASAIALARVIRYFGVGYLAIRYGDQALPYLSHHKLQVLVFAVLFVLISYLLSRLVLRPKPEVSPSN
jgi:membrane protein YqaA with SNARE-associated domain